MLNLIYLINFIIILKLNNNKIEMHSNISWEYSYKAQHFKISLILLLNKYFDPNYKKK